MRGTARLCPLPQVVVFALAALALLPACGGDGGDDASSPADSNLAGERGDNDTAGRTGSADRCPLSAEQVGSAVGATVEKDAASCTFYPADDTLPTAGFVRQLAFACKEDIRAETGYDEELSGLSVDAYVQPETATGTMVLVCTDPPFEITVDTSSGPGPETDAAKKLAALVLGD